MRAEAGYRSSRSVLQRLAGSPLELDLSPSNTRSHVEPAALSFAASRWVAQRFHGDRAAARSHAIEYAMNALNINQRAHWRVGERNAFDDLSLLVAPIADLADWSTAEKRALIALLRAKGGRYERRFPLLATRHERLRGTWAALVQDR